MKDTPRSEDHTAADVIRRFRRGSELLACDRHRRTVSEFLARLDSGADCDDALCLELDEHFRCYECQLIRGAILGETEPSEEDQERTVMALMASIKAAPPLRAADRADVARSDPSPSAAATTRSSGLGERDSGARRASPKGGTLRPWSRMAAAAAVALGLGGAWLATERWGPAGRLTPRAEPSPPVSQPPGGREPEPPSSLFSADIFVTLSPGLTRGPGRQEPLVVEAGVAAVHVQLNLERHDYARYDVALETPEGRQLWHIAGASSVDTAAGNAAVTIVLPASLLAEGDYVIRLAESGSSAGGQVIEAYALRIVKP